jgi:hypothetical protein
MRIDGEWLQCDDGIVRPILRCEVLAGDGSWRAAEFLLDTGADRTVLSANLLGAIDIRDPNAGFQIHGVGGIARTITVKTQIRMPREDNIKVTFRGEFAACEDPTALDMSVLGRDVTNVLVVLVDRPANRVCLLGPPHGYSIHSR